MDNLSEFPNLHEKSSSFEQNTTFRYVCVYIYSVYTCIQVELQMDQFKLEEVHLKN